MPLEPEFLELMNDVIILEPATGQDAYSRRTYGPAQRIENCHVQYRLEMMPTPSGQEVLKAASVYIPNALTVGLNDRLTLPSGATPKILMAGTVNDERGPHHTVVHLGVAGGSA